MAPFFLRCDLKSTLKTFDWLQLKYLKYFTLICIFVYENESLPTFTFVFSVTQ